MFAGHIGAGLALKRVEPRLNLGVLMLAAMLLDLLFWAFALVGVENIVVPPDYAARRYFEFVFPYSHGLVASLVWSTLAGLLAARWGRSSRMGAVTAAAVFSHFVLDALVHMPEMPVLGESSPKIGVGLWNQLPLALGVELAVATVGLLFYFGTAGKHQRIIATILTVSVAAMTVGGQLFAKVPASLTPMAVSSLVMILVIVAIGYWADRRMAKSFTP